MNNLFSIGDLPRGKNNCITDVEGVRVGHVTLSENRENGEKIQTGVTSILPHGQNLFLQKVRSASYVINGFGKTAGLIQVDELGLIESPIMLTNTFSVGNVWQGTLEYMLDQTPEIGESTGSVNIVVGECNDSYLNSVRLQAVKPSHAVQAIRAATTAPSENGAVGAGAGTLCLGFKGGIGTSSRIIKAGEETFTAASLVQTNFGRREENHFLAERLNPTKEKLPDGSIMIILAVDVPMSDRQLKRLAKRAVVGLSRSGSSIHHGSGDVVIAFTTENTVEHQQEGMFEEMKMIREDHPVMNDIFKGAAEAVEEAIFSSIYYAEDTEGRKGRSAPSFGRHFNG
ncbi:P1 family peptidase [Rossellomorea vietnamensis]|uniref:P1 family peptidase n=1 Tax=Rossellomorea vietnamensis TaxID=218284 RepID=A0A5D4M6Y4_9BACI|nr:P1 family peptidase [Rossellomorea vietnamensis]TYR97634.1 P1 family peptidase [Rossellomorea vietnamensis]